LDLQFGDLKMKNPQVDFKGAAARMLTGKKVYGAGGTKPNPSGRNQFSSRTAYARIMRKKQQKNV
jgi:hypothetical protein